MKFFLSVIISLLLVCLFIIYFENVAQPNKFLGENQKYQNITQYKPKMITSENNKSLTVYITPHGQKFHYSSSCAGKNAMAISFDEVAEFYDACKKCAQ